MGKNAKGMSLTIILLVIIPLVVVQSNNVKADLPIQNIPLVTPHYTERAPEIYFVSPTIPHSMQQEIQSEGSNGSVNYYSSSVRHNLTLFLYVDAMPSPNGGSIQLTNVSYKASWQKEPIMLYENPSIHEFGMPSRYNVSMMSFRCNLIIPNVPEGNQQLEITAVKEGIYVNMTHTPASYASFIMTSSAVLNFNSSMPNGTSSESSQANIDQNLTILIVVVMVLSISIAIVLIIIGVHRKTAKI
jgi:hypothetical protein